MSALDFLLPWDSQPQEAVGVDWENPVSQGLDVLARQLDSDVLTTTGRVVLSRAGTPTVAASAQGLAATFGNSSSNYFAATGLFPTTANGVGYTYLICYVMDAIGTLNIPMHCDQGDRVFQIQVSTTGQPTFIPFNTGSSAFSVTGQAIAAGVPVVVVARATPTAASLWANGVKATDTAITGTLQGHLPSTAVLQIGARQTSGTPFNGKIALVARWNRPISDAEAAAISANPWQLFAPRSIQVPVSAGGGDPTAALANNLATTASGILVPALALATTGNSATASQGTATPALSLATAGNAATASPGTPVASISLALTGNGATSSVGTVGVGGTTQALTGNEATASAGTPVAQISLALTGNASTASVGTAVPALSLAATGNAATTSAGTPTAALSLALAGNGATASAGTVAVPGVIVPSSNVATASSGTVSPGITVALTGNGVTASVGTVSPAISLALSGLAGTSSAGIVVPGLSTALTGNAATSAAGSVAVATGNITLALSGNAATAANGLLTVGASLPTYTYVVAAEIRTLTVAAENRTYISRL